MICNCRSNGSGGRSWRPPGLLAIMIGTPKYHNRSSSMINYDILPKKEKQKWFKRFFKWRRCGDWEEGDRGLFFGSFGLANEVRGLPPFSSQGCGEEDLRYCGGS